MFILLYIDHEQLVMLSSHSGVFINIRATFCKKKKSKTSI